MVEPIDISDSTKSRISEEFTLIFTGKSRSASSILSNSVSEGKFAIDNLKRIRVQADEAKDFLNSGRLSDLGSLLNDCLLYTSPSPRDTEVSRMPSSA